VHVKGALLADTRHFISGAINFLHVFGFQKRQLLRSWRHCHKGNFPFIIQTCSRTTERTAWTSEWPTIPWQYCTIKLATWCLDGKMSGCLSFTGKLACCKRPPKQYTSQTMIGLSSRRERGGAFPRLKPHLRFWRNASRLFSLVLISLNASFWRSFTTSAGAWLISLHEIKHLRGNSDWCPALCKNFALRKVLNLNHYATAFSSLIH